MNYQQMHKDSLASRHSKSAKARKHHLSLADLGKVAPVECRESAKRHFYNLMATRGKESKAVKVFAAQWNFEIPS